MRFVKSLTSFRAKSKFILFQRPHTLQVDLDLWLKSIEVWPLLQITSNFFFISRLCIKAMYRNPGATVSKGDVNIDVPWMGGRMAKIMNTTDIYY